MSAHPNNNFMADAMSNLNNVSVAEDTVMVPPYDASELHSVGSVTRANLEKKQPMYLANQIRGLGNAGAVLYIQNFGTKKFTHMTNKFYLQALDITQREKVQILETFGAPVASFFGATAKVYNFSGVALEAETQRGGEDNRGEYFHGTSLLHMYESALRGTRLVEENSIAILQVMNHSIYGYPLQFSFRSLSENDKAIQFSFSMFVKEHLYELPDVIDKTMINRNNRMQDVDNKSVRKLEKLLEMLKPVITTLKNRMDKRWLEITDEAALAPNLIATVAQLTEGEITETDITSAGDAITAARDKFTANVNDYVSTLEQTLPNPPSSLQASSFGLSAEKGSIEKWPENLKSDLNLAWEWMPYSQSSGTNKVAIKQPDQSSLSTENYLAANQIDVRTLGKNIDEIKEAGIANENLGNTSFNTLQQVLAVRMRVNNRLSVFLQTLAVGGNANKLGLV